MRGKTGQKHNLFYSPARWPGAILELIYFLIDINEDILVDVDGNTLGAW